MKTGYYLRTLGEQLSKVINLFRFQRNSMMTLNKPILNTSNATPNLIERTNTLLADIKKNGFRGVKVQRIEKESVWHPEYAIFVLEFNIPIIGFMSHRQTDCEYCHREWFDEDQLKEDFENHVRKLFPECEISVSYQGKEFEIIGRNNKNFYDYYQDELEEVYMQDDYKPGMVWIPEDYK